MIQIDTNKGMAEVNGARIALTPTQLALFETLHKRSPRAVHRESLFQSLYGNRVDGGPDGQVLSVLVHQIRCKMQEAGWPVSIRCKNGFGYWLEMN